jgi:hypothetical protein
LFQTDCNLIAILFSLLTLQFKGKTVFWAGWLVQMIPQPPVSVLNSRQDTPDLFLTENSGSNIQTMPVAQLINSCITVNAVFTVEIIQ